MPSTNPLDELRRRIGHGTTPVAFAALAEEHRRAGRLDEAVAVCREGLERYPTYASARVTLGRALLDLGDVGSALSELEEAVAQAPDNLAAVRALDMARLRLDEACEPAVPPGVLAAAPATEERSDDVTPSEAVPPDAFAWLGPAADEAVPPDALAWLGPAADKAVDDTDEATFATELSAADDERSAEVTPPWDAIVVVPTDADAAFSWAASPSPPSDSAFASWNMSVEDAVADVFADAEGHVLPPVAAEATVPAADALADPLVGPLGDPLGDRTDAPANGPLDSLQTLLATIRARRALLSEPQSGVD